MSEVLAATKPGPAPVDTSESHMLAEIEKWLETIREINRERDSETKFRG